MATRKNIRGSKAPAETIRTLENVRLTILLAVWALEAQAVDRDLDIAQILRRSAAWPLTDVLEKMGVVVS